jgi:hypothetical protein
MPNWPWYIYAIVVVWWAALAVMALALAYSARSEEDPGVTRLGSYKELIQSRRQTRPSTPAIERAYAESLRRSRGRRGHDLA